MSDSKQTGSGRQLQTVVLTDYERELRDRIFANPSDWPDSAKVWIADYVSQNSLLPISQVQGFTLFTAKYAEVLTPETTTSTSYTDLDTIGPTVEGLAPGQYVVVMSLSMAPDGPGKNCQAGISINEAAVSATDPTVFFAIPGGVSSWGSGVQSIAMFKTFTDPNNSLEMKYRVSSSTTGTFTYRSIIALRVGNP